MFASRLGATFFVRGFCRALFGLEEYINEVLSILSSTTR